jgi:hypothetical protein
MSAKHPQRSFCNNGLQSRWQQGCATRLAGSIVESGQSIFAYWLGNLRRPRRLAAAATPEAEAEATAAAAADAAATAATETAAAATPATATAAATACAAPR